jgi:amino acid permease
MCHHNSFLLYNSLAERSIERWEKITHVSVVCSAFFIIVFGAFGYATFTGLTQGMKDKSKNVYKKNQNSGMKRHYHLLQNRTQ